MATRWNKRRLTATLVLTGIIGLLYYQSKTHEAAAFPPSQFTDGQAFSSPVDSSTPDSAAADSQAPAVSPNTPTLDLNDGKFHFASMKLLNPIEPSEMRKLPRVSPVTLNGIPKIQHTFGTESADAKALRLARLEQVRNNFTHAWTGYKTYAWMADELKPVKGAATSHFGGWSATLVDTLDTLWIMGFRDEFESAVAAAEKIDFSTTDVQEVNVFETTIRYLGGFLAAYDLSEGKYPSLLLKAIELGDMLYLAFDTPNHVPVTRWKMSERRKGIAQVPHKTSLVSELGSLSLEFTRLSQLTGNNKYFDAIQRIMDMFAEQQDQTHLPGMWPVIVDAERGDFTGSTGFTIGGMADSLYEYLPKEYLMLGGAIPSYREMYIKSLDAMNNHIFFRPRVNNAKPILFAGDKNTNGQPNFDGVKEIVRNNKFSPGVLKYDDKRYILRPEAIESVFILYRLTGDKTLMDRAWSMFESIVASTQTPIAHTAVSDCTNPKDTWADSMESFWLAETLKYFYLIFETPDVVSLDTYVLNTEAHPLRRPSL